MKKKNKRLIILLRTVHLFSVCSATAELEDVRHKHHYFFVFPTISLFFSAIWTFLSSSISSRSYSCLFGAGKWSLMLPYAKLSQYFYYAYLCVSLIVYLLMRLPKIKSPLLQCSFDFKFDFQGWYILQSINFCL